MIIHTNTYIESTNTYKKKADIIYTTSNMDAKSELFQTILLRWTNSGAHALKIAPNVCKPVYSDDNTFDCIQKHLTEDKYQIAYDEGWLYKDYTRSVNEIYVMFISHEIYGVLLDPQKCALYGITPQKALEWRNRAHNAALCNQANVVDANDYEGLKAALKKLEESRSGTPDTVENFPLDNLIQGC